MSAWELPTSLNVGGVDFAIRADFRAILDILQAFQSAEYEDDEKWLICLDILYEDFDGMPEYMYQEAMEKAVWFIDLGGDVQEGKPRPSLMDWEQDANMIIPSVNRVIGHEIRLDSFLHWWTFIGAYMEIGECSFSHILNIRSKKASGKKLEKWEQEYYKDNKSVIDLKRHKTAEEEEEEQLLIDKFG